MACSNKSHLKLCKDCQVQRAIDGMIKEGPQTCSGYRMFVSLFSRFRSSTSHHWNWRVCYWSDIFVRKTSERNEPTHLDFIFNDLSHLWFHLQVAWRWSSSPTAWVQWRIVTRFVSSKEDRPPFRERGERIFWKEELCKQHVSNEKKTGCWGYIGDYTTQFYRDYNKPL